MGGFPRCLMGTAIKIVKVEIWLQSGRNVKRCAVYGCCHIKWYHAVRTAEEVQTLRDRAKMLRYMYIACIVYFVRNAWKPVS
jgi:hypothetical protein